MTPLLGSKKRFSFSTARRSHPGGRPVNEDAADYAVVERSACWVVADGLGGHGRGDVASAAAVANALETFRAAPGISQAALEALVDGAQEAVLHAQREHDYPSMRTTISLITASGRTAWSAHVGDTRVYHFRDGGVVHQSLDHSVPQMLVEAGDLVSRDIRTHPDRSRILRALGQEDRPRASFSKHEIEEGDAFLLCTDGWWELVTEDEMELDFAKSMTPDGWLERMADRILTRGEGEFDNLTAIAVFVGPEAD